MNETTADKRRPKLLLTLCLGTLTFLSACAGPVRTPAHGAARGAAVGAVVGNQFRSNGSGARGRGAAIGAATGMAVGGSRMHRSNRHHQPTHRHQW